MNRPPASLFVGVTGASGAPYAVRLVQVLADAGCELSLCLSEAGVAVVAHELELGVSGRAEVTAAFLAAAGAEARVYAPDDLEAPVASGSNFPDAAVVCPCSMSSVAHIALGTTRTLIHRVADVALKEGRPLVLVPRETPLSEIHLARLLEARRAGATIVAPMPGFYALPRTLDDVVDFVAGKVLAALGFEQRLSRPWEGPRR
ncbi:MAG: UbiX family flavin prenyltransferase [Thermoleophilia bacterium]